MVQNVARQVTQEGKNLDPVERANEQLAQYYELIEELWGVRYEPRSECSSCGHRLSFLETLRGFNKNQENWTTCPKCKVRVEATLIVSGYQWRQKIPFLSPTQALARLKEFRYMKREEFQKINPELYHSVCAHFGSLRAAFERIGIRYPLLTRKDWKGGILPHIGDLPDTVIARVVGVSLGSVQTLRARHTSPCDFSLWTAFRLYN